MRRATLFHLDALFSLIVGFILLFNPLLGPVLPIPGGVIALVSVGLLVAACVIGRAGMGKGALIQRIRTLAVVNGLCGLAVGLWAVLACVDGGRILMLIFATGLLILAVSQFVYGVRPNHPGTIGRVNAVRATPEELLRVLHHKPID